MSSRPGWGRIKSIGEHTDSCPRTVRNYLKMGLPHVRLPNGTVLIKYSDVDGWLKHFEVNTNRTDQIVNEIFNDFVETK